MNTNWDAKQYQQRHSYVFQYGQAVLDLLAPQKGERILDLGCGSGQLTAAIADAGATVIGIDSSPEMLAEARAHYRAVEFRLGDAADFAMESPVDAVFSNAVLHWVKNAAGAAACIARVLKPSGRFVVEFGGQGTFSQLWMPFARCWVRWRRRGITPASASTRVCSNKTVWNRSKLG
jgi:trans-aconitate methyltransferase